jgi:PAS domain S-box-containing protein
VESEVPVVEVEELHRQLAEAEARIADLVAVQAQHERQIRELREVSERMRARFDQAKVGYVSVVVESGKIDGCNHYFERVVGKNLAQLKDLQFWELFTPDEVGRIRKLFFEVSHGSVTRQIETTLMRSDGSVVEVEMTNQVIQVEGRELVVSFVRDVTEQKQAEVLLREQKEHMQQYLDIADVILVAFDLSDHVTMINRHGAEILGYTVEEVIGKQWLTTFVPEDFRDVVSVVFTGVEGGDIGPAESFENPILTKNGKTRLIAWRNSLITDGHGNITGLLSSGQDITDSRRAEEELGRYREHLEVLVAERTAEMRKLLNMMTGREVRMAELKDVIRKLRAQLVERGLQPEAGDPLGSEGSDSD